MSYALKNVSIIIPARPDELYLENLLSDLKKLNLEAQIIVSEEGSRAKSLNEGAKKSNRDFLWFLHADSNITLDNIRSLEENLRKKPHQLHFFDLEYSKEVYFCFLNAFGANIRSRLFSLPYGDQGFCISKENFLKTSFFHEDTPYGEDLLFALEAKRLFGINRIPSKLKTSARRYKENGWLKTSLDNQYILLKLLFFRNSLKNYSP